MLELSLHILDIAENSTRAGARHIDISLEEDSIRDLLTISVKDDGFGMSDETIKKALDPFYTTKKVRRVGLGLPMLADAAQRTGGKLTLTSKEGCGTNVTVKFGLSHIDRQPLGNIAGTMVTLIAGNPNVEFVYRHRRDDCEYVLNTCEIKKEIDDIPINHVEILNYIKADIVEGLIEIGAQA
ncbi:MAG: sensor histidine kinase [Deltaproteobacteria bacterium]|nr:sensor histidine kinase [Deltaproteobacteria bacterium]